MHKAERFRRMVFQLKILNTLCLQKLEGEKEREKGKQKGSAKITKQVQICLDRLRREPPKSRYISGKTKQKWESKGRKPG